MRRDSYDIVSKECNSKLSCLGFYFDTQKNIISYKTTNNNIILTNRNITANGWLSKNNQWPVQNRGGTMETITALFDHNSEYIIL